MGFFTDLKEDLAMAVNELMPEETEETIRTADSETDSYGEQPKEVEGQEEKTETSKDIQVLAEDFELDKMLENLDTLDMGSEQTTEQSAAEPAKFNEPEEHTEPEEQTGSEEPIEPEKRIESEKPTEPEETVETAEEEVILTALPHNEKNTWDEGKEENMDQMANRTISDETAVITQGMVITGDVISEGSMDVIGTINGNIDILGKLNITGTIQGNSKASEIFADSAKITGEVVSQGSVKIGQSSVIIGNITATSAVIAGAVKGDIDVQGPVILDTSAIVMGNIKSKSVQINNGAVIEGMCSQCYADVNPTSFFEELKKNK